MLYQAFFRSLDALGFSVHALELFNWMDEKVWEAGDTLRRYGDLGTQETSGVMRVNNKAFSWELQAQVANEIENECTLYEVILDVYWKEGQRNEHLFREGFFLSKKN